MEGLATKKPMLPYGWIERISKTFPNRVYYFNTMTGASTWIVPFMLKGERDKAKRKDARAKLKKRSRLSQERDSGISSTTGGSVSPHDLKRTTPQRKDDSEEFIQAEFSPTFSPRSASDDDGLDLPRVDDRENAPLWSDFMNGYIQGSGDGFETDLLDSVTGATTSLFDTEPTDSRKEDIGDPLRGKPEQYPSMGNHEMTGSMDLENGLVTPRRRIEEFPQHEMTEKGLTDDKVGGHLPVSSSRRVEKVKITPFRRHSDHDPLVWEKHVQEQRDTRGKRKRAASSSRATENSREGPPRRSVKDRLGWKNYKQEKSRSRDKQSSPRGRGRADRGEEKQMSPRERGRLKKVSESESREENNNVKKKTGERRRLLTSWEEEDATMGNDKTTQEEKTGTPMETGDTIKDFNTGGVRKSTKPKTPVQGPPPVEYSGPLTVFSSEGLEDMEVDITRSNPSQTQIQSKKLNIILDTNILLSYLNFVEELRDQFIPGFGRPMLVIPWIVLHELDCLKEGKPSDLKDVRGSYKGSLSNKAKSAVTFINSCLINKHPRVQGQSIQECSKKDRGVYTRSNDDKILQCLLQYKNRGKSTENVLVTEDMSLRNKAIVSSIHAYSKEDIMDGLKSLSKNITNTLPKKCPKGLPRKAATKSAVRISPKRTQQKTPRMLTDAAVTDLVDNLVCNLRNLLRGPLSVVLETEMKAAFESLWPDVILRKPPWTFLDILDCFQKHWIAVFSQICSRSTKNSFDKIRVFYKINKGLGANLKSAEELLEDALQFLIQLKVHSSFNGALDAPISSLNNYVEQLALVKTSSPRAQIAKTETTKAKPKPCSTSRNEKIMTMRKAVQDVEASRLQRTKKIVAKKSEAATTEILPKKIKLNRSCWKSKTSSLPPSKKLAINVNEEVAMDTSSETDISIAVRDDDDEVTTTPSSASVKASCLSGRSNNVKSSPSTSFSKSGKSPLKVDASTVENLSEQMTANVYSEDALPPDKDVAASSLMPSTPAAMWRQMSRVPSKLDISSSGDINPSPHLVGDTSPSSSSADRVRGDNNTFVLRVLDTAYKEMYAMCTKVDSSVRQDQNNEYATAQLNLKEALTLVEYLLRYIEKQIIAMNKVVTAAESNGLMASVSGQIFQELIDVIDGFFIGMEISSSGCGLTPARLKEFLKTDENCESLRRGICQYQVALNGCQQCYQFLSQVLS